MIREIVTDVDALSKPCDMIAKKDFKRARAIVQDLMETAIHNNETNEKKCCGLAANQIGENVKIFIAQMPDGRFEPFINAVIVAHSNSTHESTEACMSLEGERTVTRYDSISVMYQTMAGKYVKRNFGGFTAVELQHEIDHTKGILI